MGKSYAALSPSTRRNSTSFPCQQKPPDFSDHRKNQFNTMNDRSNGKSRLKVVQGYSSIFRKKHFFSPQDWNSSFSPANPSQAKAKQAYERDKLSPENT
jgi:hypothetical protein